MERYGFDFAVTYIGVNIWPRTACYLPVQSIKSLHQLIDYAREHRKEITLSTKDGSDRFSDHEF